MSILKILKEFKTNKRTGVDNLAGRFTFQICFAYWLKYTNILTPRTSGQSRCFHLSLRLYGKLFMIKLWIFYQITMSYTNMNQVLETFTQQTLACHTSMTKSQKVSILVSWPGWFLLICKTHSIHLTKTLIKKMPFLGFTDEIFKWYTSYLSNRKFIISMENANSNKASRKVQFWHCSF